MVKTKSEKTTAQKAADIARINYQTAKEADASKKNPTSKIALDKATDLLKAAVKVENRERFLNVGVNRTKKARAAIRQLVRVFNPKSYDFTHAEGVKITDGLTAAVEEVKKALAVSQSGAKTAEATDDFAL